MSKADVSASAVSQSVPAAIRPAADLSKFQPGNIISDAVFFNKNTMTEAQIQSFLQSKVSSCVAGYTCLKDKYDTSRTTTADAMCGAYSGGVRERASRIIYKVAQACGINPQVILVTLQKEQGLVTHRDPSDWRYTIAMGQGCPDTAACDTRYYGFFNQVYGAAWQLKRYGNPPGTSNYFNWYAPGKTWNVRFHPNASCGSTPVYIQNQATANLYYYTPYQPNAAAIRAGYAAANDPCSSYGNRNFYNYFTDWFGSTHGVPGAAFVSLESSAHVTALASDGTIWAYPFTGAGKWGPRKAVAQNANGIATLLSPGDFDGDGRRDLIGVDDAGKAYLWRGDGGSAYRPPGSMLVDWKDAVHITDAGDFDGDGIPDVFTTTPRGELMLWRGTGTGTFRQPIQVGNGWSGMNLLSGGADLSGDGKPDLIARDTAGKLWLYRGNGAGAFSTKSQIGSGWSSMKSIFVPGNFAGTSHPDILAVSATGALLAYTGAGNGTIRAAGTVGNGWGGMGAVLGNAAASSILRTHQGGAGDLNGDGARDVLALTSTGDLRSYQGNGAGGWAGTSTVATGWSASDRLVTLGDFTGDGEPDIGRIDSRGAFTLLPSTGSGKRGEPVLIGNGWATMMHVVGGLDFDGDGAVDVLAVDASGRMSLYRGDGRGGWKDESRPVVGNGWQINDLVITPGDWDGDGAPDLLARRAAGGALWHYPLSGRSTFLEPRSIGNGWSVMQGVTSPGQFDGRGGPDIIAYGSDGKLYLYGGDGKGGWLGSRTQLGARWQGMAGIG
ncbi:FG-GAP repeat domain-containing protein [Microbacterium sp. NPDC055357]